MRIPTDPYFALRSNSKVVNYGAHDYMLYSTTYSIVPSKSQDTCKPNVVVVNAQNVEIISKDVPSGLTFELRGDIFSHF